MYWKVKNLNKVVYQIGYRYRQIFLIHYRLSEYRLNSIIGASLILSSKPSYLQGDVDSTALHGQPRILGWKHAVALGLSGKCSEASCTDFISTIYNIVLNAPNSEAYLKITRLYSLIYEPCCDGWPNCLCLLGTDTGQLLLILPTLQYSIAVLTLISLSF